MTGSMPHSAAQAVAEWTTAMGGVTPGPWRPSRLGFQVVSDYPEPAWQSVVELQTVSRSSPNVEREMETQQAIANWIARCSPTGIRSLLDLIAQQAARLEEVTKERDEAQSATTAWQQVFESIEAHLQDRVAMNDPASPATYLNIIRSYVANVQRDSRQIVSSRWADAARAHAALTAAEAEVGRLRAALKPLAERVDEIEQVKAVAKFATEGTAAVKLSLLREARACLSSKKEG